MLCDRCQQPMKLLFISYYCDCEQTDEWLYSHDKHASGTSRLELDNYYAWERKNIQRVLQHLEGVHGREVMQKCLWFKFKAKDVNIEDDSHFDWLVRVTGEGVSVEYIPLIRLYEDK